MNKFCSQLLLIALCMVIFSCKKDSTYSGDYNLEEIKSYKNEASTLNTKMDSAQAIDFISKQKLREFYELSTLAINSNDSTVSQMLWEQLKTYFPKTDSMKIKSILEEMKAKNVKFASIENLKIQNLEEQSDTVKKINYTVNYFAESKKLVESNNRISIAVLKLEPIKFKKEFKFYFKTLDDKASNDTIPLGDTIRSNGTSPR